MYKHYPCIIVDQADTEAICEQKITFKNNRPENPEVYDKLEDYFRQPIVSVHESNKNPGEIIVITADGFVQTNPITNKRLVIINGEIEDLKIILKDIFAERLDKTPEQLYEKYSFSCPVKDQFRLNDWFKQQYIQNKK